MITITSRYVLFNNSSEPLQYGQRNTNLVWQLAPGVKAPFHWDDADGRFELCVRPAQGKWNWSGAFEVTTSPWTHLVSFCLQHQTHDPFQSAMQCRCTDNRDTDTHCSIALAFSMTSVTRTSCISCCSILQASLMSSVVWRQSCFGAKHRTLPR